MRSRALCTVAGLVLLAVYGYRAATGVVAGLALERGFYLEEDDAFGEAVALHERAAVGFNRLRAVMATADGRLDTWRLEAEGGGPLASDRHLLELVAQSYHEALCLCPASRVTWLGLATAYDYMERTERERRAQWPLPAVDDPWARVGRSGRIAIGMARRGIERVPHWFDLRDRLAIMLWTYRLERESLDAVTESARVLPLFWRRSYADLAGELPREILEAFLAGSREVVGRTPLLLYTDHLLDLGKLERLLGHKGEAEKALREVLAGPSDQVTRAEARFQLGLTLLDSGQTPEGMELLAIAAEHPLFRAPALSRLAEAEKDLGRLDQALDHLRRLRREDPLNIDYCLRTAEVARQMGLESAAVEALHWARQNHPRDPRPHKELVALRLDGGDRNAAHAALREFELAVPDDPDLPALRARVGGVRSAGR